jgi:hypothetical protein
MLAMLTKETSIVFPVLALLYFYNTLGRGIISITTLLFFVGWGIVLFNWYILRSAAMIAPVGNMLQVFVSVLSNIPLALCYLGNIFWPIDIAYAPIPSDIHIASGIVSAGSILLAIFLSERKDWKIIIFGVMWFLVFLLPTLYYKTGVLAPPKFFEHRIYLPFMGIIFMLLSLSYSNKLEYFKRLSLPIYFLGTVFLGWLSYTHTLNFKNYFTLSEYDASTSPNDLRRYNDITRMNIPLKLNNEMIAVKGELQLQESKRTPITKEGLWKIIDDLKNEIKVNGNDAKLHHALAIAYFARGLLFSSEKNFFTALQEEPQNAIVPYNLGILYYSSYEGTKAEKAWQEALRLDPSMGNAHLNLSFLYYEEGQYRSAWDHCQKAMQLGTTIPVGLAEEIRRNDSY